MLTELNISNFAIINNLRLNLAPGFNVLTGETGAGRGAGPSAPLAPSRVLVIAARP